VHADAQGHDRGRRSSARSRKCGQSVAQVRRDGLARHSSGGPHGDARTNDEQSRQHEQTAGEDGTDLQLSCLEPGGAQDADEQQRQGQEPHPARHRKRYGLGAQHARGRDLVDGGQGTEGEDRRNREPQNEATPESRWRDLQRHFEFEQVGCQE
jgi:hypothetical protein